jgi:hypothetical protein
MSHEFPQGPEVNRRTVLRLVATAFSPIKLPVSLPAQQITIAEQAAGASQLVKGILKINELGKIFCSANRALPGTKWWWGFNEIKSDQGTHLLFTSLANYSEEQYELIRTGVPKRQIKALEALDNLLEAVDSLLSCPAIQQALEAARNDCEWIHQQAEEWYKIKSESMIEELKELPDFNAEKATSDLLMEISQLPCPNSYLAFSDQKWHDIRVQLDKLILIRFPKARELEGDDSRQARLISDKLEEEFQAHLDRNMAAVEDRFLERLGFSPDASCRYRELFRKDGQTLLSFLMGRISSPFNSPLCFEEWLNFPSDAQDLPRLVKPFNFLSSKQERAGFRELIAAGWRRNSQIIDRVISLDACATLPGKPAGTRNPSRSTDSSKDPFEVPNTERPLCMEEQVRHAGPGYIAIELPSSLSANELDLRPIEFIRSRLSINEVLQMIADAPSIIPASEGEISFKSLMQIKKPATTLAGSCVIRVSPRDSMADVTIIDGDATPILLPLAPGDHLYVLLTDTRVVSVTSGTPAECILDNKFFYFEQPLPKEEP